MFLLYGRKGVRTMQSKGRNIYRNARDTAGLTREQAAELLYISVRSLADYESGKTIPPDDAVCRMVEAYGAVWLGYEHLAQSTAVGRRYLPDIDFTDLAKAVLRLQKESDDVQKINSEMITVACDGAVTDQEQKTWDQVTKEVMEMVGAGLGVIFCQKEKGALV